MLFLSEKEASVCYFDTLWEIVQLFDVLNPKTLTTYSKFSVISNSLAWVSVSTSVFIECLAEVAGAFFV